MSETVPKLGVLIQNDSGQAIPPRSVVVISSIEITQATDLNESYAIAHVTQYAGQAGNILVTGAATIQSGATGTGGWTSSKSFGRGFTDQRIYVSIDPNVSPPTPGEEWGPVPNQWYVSRGKPGFVCDGYPTADIPDDADPTFPFGQTAIFYRVNPATHDSYYGMIRSTVSPGTLSSPTCLLFDVWLPQTSSGSSSSSSGSPCAIPYAVATDPSLLGMQVANVGCFSVSSGSDGSSSGSGSSDGQIMVPARIEYDATAGQWVLVWIGRCTQVATSVSCGPGGLTVTYGNLPA